MGDGLGNGQTPERRLYGATFEIFRTGDGAGNGAFDPQGAAGPPGYGGGLGYGYSNGDGGSYSSMRPMGRGELIDG